MELPVVVSVLLSLLQPELLYFEGVMVRLVMELLALAVQAVGGLVIVGWGETQLPLRAGLGELLVVVAEQIRLPIGAIVGMPLLHLGGGGVEVMLQIVRIGQGGQGPMARLF
jgi:hypothetical protein